MIKTLFSVCLVLFLTACATVQIPDYIRADHPYTRRITGDYDTILIIIKHVMAQEGFPVQNETNPSEYERREGGEDQSRDVLYFTKVKRHRIVMYKSYEHWNVFIHPNADGAEVDLRYQVLTPGSLRPLVTRNDKAAKRILDKIENSI